MDMIRIRLPELLSAKIPTAYAIAMASNERISMSAAHRIVAAKGAVARYDAELIDALCDVFDIEPGELFEREPRKGRGRR